jgi:hypothetical protein
MIKPKVLLEFAYPDGESDLRHALHGGKAIEGLLSIKNKIDFWEAGDRVCPDDLIDSVKQLAVSCLNNCGEI